MGLPNVRTEKSGSRGLQAGEKQKMNRREDGQSETGEQDRDGVRREGKRMFKGRQASRTEDGQRKAGAEDRGRGGWMITGGTKDGVLVTGRGGRNPTSLTRIRVGFTFKCFTHLAMLLAAFPGVGEWVKTAI
jgi:hypothetical protein